MLTVLAISFSYFLSVPVQAVDYNMMVNILINNYNQYIAIPGSNLSANGISKFFTQDYIYRKKNFVTLKQELIEQNVNNKVIMDGLNSIHEFKDGSCFYLKNNVAGVIYKDHTAITHNLPYHEYSIEVFHFQNNHIFTFLNQINDWIAEKITKNNNTIAAEYPTIKRRDWIDNETGTSYNAERDSFIMENSSLIKARFQLDDITSSIGKKLQAIEPNFNIEVFKEAVFADPLQLTPIQTEVMNSAIDLVGQIF